MRTAFERVRRDGLLEDIPGLVYAAEAGGPPEVLVNTGVQRLVCDMDELPRAVDALGLFERPHRRAGLDPTPVPIDQMGRYASVVSLIMTHGCKFHCPYCPIPAYNQFTFRSRSPERLVEEIAEIAERTGIWKFFGTDDNFFNQRPTSERLLGIMAQGKVHGRPFRDAIAMGTEGTEQDVFAQKDLVPLARDAGIRSIWFGIEDVTANLVKKGQSPEKTALLFKLLLQHGIAPMPMMMHHDGQPLWTWRGLYGLINQVAYLRRIGAPTCQVTLLTPSVGSRGYEEAFVQNQVLLGVGGRPVEEYQYDGNHCVATSDPKPWRRQVNMLLSYAAFYNPLNFVRSMFRFDPLWGERTALQVYGMIGVVRSAWKLRGWLGRLLSGPIERSTEPPQPKYAMIPPRCDALTNNGDLPQHDDATANPDLSICS
jgi:radical SAM superfamily enzyme YgiQ (UPF0313 family)